MSDEISGQGAGIGTYDEVLQAGKGFIRLLESIRVPGVTPGTSKHCLETTSQITAQGSERCEMLERLGAHSGPDDMAFNKVFQRYYSIGNGVVHRLDRAPNMTSTIPGQ